MSGGVKYMSKSCLFSSIIFVLSKLERRLVIHITALSCLNVDANYEFKMYSDGGKLLFFRGFFLNLVSYGTRILVQRRQNDRASLVCEVT